MADTVPPLAPGKAAGIHQAQMESVLLVPAGLTGAITAALVVAASDTGGMAGIAGIAANPTFTTVTTTSTSGTD